MPSFMQFNRLPEAALAIHRATAKAVVKACMDVQATAASKAPVISGYLKSSIYTHTWNASTYGQGVVGGKPEDLLPDVGRPDNDLAAFVGVGANYGVYVEYGSSRMAARPYLTPAAEEVRPSFVAAMSRLEERMREEGFL